MVVSKVGEQVCEQLLDSWGQKFFFAGFFDFRNLPHLGFHELFFRWNIDGFNVELGFRRVILIKKKKKKIKMVYPLPGTSGTSSLWIVFFW